MPYTENGTHTAIITLLAMSARQANALAEYEPAKSDSWQTAIQAAKREYDSLRRELEHAQALARAYQESERSVRDKLQAATGSRG